MQDMIEETLQNNYKQYANLQHSIPYIYRLSSQDHSILYCGTSHYSDYADPGMQMVIKLFRSYNPDLILVEGIPWLKDSTLIKKLMQYSEKDLIHKFGENILFSVLASQSGQAVISPEPLLKNEMSFICSRGYSIWEFLTFYMFKLGVQWLRQQDKESIEVYIKKCDAYLCNELSEIYLQYQIEFKKKMRVLLERAIMYHIEMMMDPIPRKNQNYFYGKYNHISRLSNICRDIEVIKVVKQNSQKYFRIMIVYGATHAYVQRGILESYYTGELDMV